jgi:hypothetical protein
MTATDTDIATLADQANTGNKENRLDVPSIRNWLCEFLETLDEEFEQFPGERHVAQWDLVAADYTQQESVAVVVTVFVDETFTVLSGQGDDRVHFEFGEADDFPEDSAGIIAAAHAAFRLGPCNASIGSETVRGWSAPAD